MREEKRTHNIGLAIWRLKCFYETFVQGSTAVILLNFCAKNPPHRQAANRQAVKKPFFHLNFPYFPIATTQIEPFKKAVFFRLHV